MNEPDYAPPKPPIVRGVCEVQAADSKQYFTVDLDNMVCDCKHGKAWHPQRTKYVPANLCNHKLKAIASLCQQNPEDETLRDYYDLELGKRNNAFEAISAMHKEIRRGDATQAIYWATMMIPHRGKHGVVSYLLNILFEETRDLPLARYILRVSSKGKSVSLLEMQRAVTRFALAPKKWELPWRYEIFMDEMKGYKRLAADYGYEVAKGKDIIDPKAHSLLKGLLLQGFETADRPMLQTGLKGWFKSKSADHDQMKFNILNCLIEVLNGEHPNKFDYDSDYVMDLYDVLMRRIRNHGTIGYHEINALCDALSGENGHDPRATLPPKVHKATITQPKEKRIKLGVMRRVPLYAHDNHTWGGKAKMRTYREQLRPGADQHDLDFRLCGAYMGVAWRTLAFKQHGAIDCNWSDVSWKRPNWLWQHLDNMWY